MPSDTRPSAPGRQPATIDVVRAGAVLADEDADVGAR